MVHILPHWTHPTLKKGTEIPVWVYSNCDEVELFLNGKSLGKDKPGTKWDEMQCEWMVPWNSGTITAKAYINGKEVASTGHTTAASPASIQLKNELTNSEDNTAIITTTITDSADVFYPYGENTIYYRIDGAARIISMENGDPVDTTKNVGVNYRRAFMGLTRTFIETDKMAKNVSLSAGSILGEKQLLTSNKVFIAVKNITLKGTQNTQPTKVFYTLDGSEATQKSKLYKGSFSVNLGTTVNAIVVQNGEVILKMQERFDKNLGLCWDKQSEKSKLDDGVKGVRAIDTEFTGATIQQNKETKYLDFKGQEGNVVWYQENDGSAGDFTLKIFYASKDSNSKRPMDLIVNNKKVATVNFESTKSWNSNWTVITTTLHLQAGANYIELRSTGKSAPNLWLLQVD